MAWSTAGRNARAAATGALIDDVSLHTGDPGGSGTSNEVSGNGYARQTPSFGSPSSGVVTATQMDYEGPASATVSHIGLWDGGTFLGSLARTGGDAAFNAAGEYGVVLSIDADGNITAS